MIASSWRDVGESAMRSTSVEIERQERIDRRDEETPWRFFIEHARAKSRVSFASLSPTNAAPDVYLRPVQNVWSDSGHILPVVCPHRFGQCFSFDRSIDRSKQAGIILINDWPFISRFNIFDIFFLFLFFVKNHARNVMWINSIWHHSCSILICFNYLNKSMVIIN